MLERAHVAAGDAVLEIGPGKGVLTKALLATGAKVIAIEKDDNLIPILKATFVSEIISGQLELVHADILEKDIEEVLGKDIQAKKYKLIANIPYYITGEIIRKFLESNHQPECMALLVQKEVAERIVAKDGKESILSMSVKAYGTPEYGGTVKRSMFRPMPNVDSAIIIIKNISKNFFKDNFITEEGFFKVVKAGFAHKRKQLGNNLKGIIKEEILNNYSQKRAENLTTEDWKIIVENRI